MGDPMGAARMPGGGPQPFQPAFPSSSPAGGLGRQPLPKQLTAAIKSCASLERLSQLFQAHQAVLNPIHIAAMITKLPKLDNSMHSAAAAAGSDLPWVLSATSAQQGQLRQLLLQLLLRLKLHGCGEYSPRGVANIVWALAKLQCAPDPELRTMLLDKFCSQLDAAVPQDISNVLWGVAKLTKERSAVLTSSMPGGGRASQSSLASLSPALPGGSSPSTASSPGMSGSGLSGGQEWMLMGLSGASPSSMAGDAAAFSAGPLLLQEQVRLLLQHLCQQLHQASVQTISNSLWAVVVLQQEHQWCMCNCLGQVQSLLSAFCEQPHHALPGHIQPVIRCMSQLASTCSNHAGDSWIAWQPRLLQRLLTYLASQREHMELHHVSSVLRDVAQIVCLHLLLARQLRDQQQQQQQGATGASDDACNPRPAEVAGGSACSSPVLGVGAATARPAAAAGAAGGSGLASLNTISVQDESEEVLARLAATGGPQDTSSTVVALAMLRPQLEALGLQQGVAGLCSMLPPAALPQLGSEVGQQLLAATSCTAPMVAQQQAAGGGWGCVDAAGTVLGVPISPGGIQRVFAAQQQQQQQQSGLLLPMVNALPGSSSSSTCSNSNLGVDGSSLQGGSGGSGSINPATGALVGGSGGSSCSPGGSAEPLPPVQLPQPPVQSPQPPAGGGEQQQQQVGQQLFGSSSSNPGAAGDATAALPAAAEAGTQTSDCGAAAAAVASPAAAAVGSSVPPPPSVSAAAAATAAGEVPRGGGDVAAAGLDSQQEAAARQLTHNIAYADSVYQLAEIFAAHSAVMDMIHITASITRLSKVLGTAPGPAAQAAAASLLPLLGAKLLEVLPHANARGIANVLWGYGRLRNLQQADLLPGLLQAFLQQLPAAACRDSAVVLWSLARLVEGQDIASVGLQPPLLQRLGSAVLQQLSAAAAAAMALPPQSQQQAQQQPEQVAAPSSRDISNSLMALTRLGFVPAGPSSSSSEAAPAAPHRSDDTMAAGEPGQAAAEAAAGQIASLSLEAAAEQPVAASSPDAAAASQRQQQPLATQLTLSVSQIQVIVRFLLQHAHTAKTLDLQEAATALKQLGLSELHGLVASAIIAHHGAPPPPPGAHGSAPGHMGGQPGLHFMQHQQVMGLHQQQQEAGMFQAGPGLYGRPQQQQQGGGGPLGLPSSINLAGTQLAGLLQQQRRQQPLPVSGPPYGAGWLEGGGGPGATEAGRLRAGAAAASALPGGGGGLRQPHMQQQYAQQYAGARRPQQQQQLPGTFVMAGDAAAGGGSLYQAAGLAGYPGDYGMPQQQQQQPPPPQEAVQWGLSPTQQQQQQLAQMRAMAATSGQLRFQQGRSSSGTGSGLPPHQQQQQQYALQQQPQEAVQWGLSPTQQQQQQLAQMRAMAAVRPQQQQAAMMAGPGSPGTGMQYLQLQQPQGGFVLQHQQQPQQALDVLGMQQMLQPSQQQQGQGQAQQYFLVPAASAPASSMLGVAGSSYAVGQPGMMTLPDWQQQQQQQGQQQQGGQQVLLMQPAAAGRQGAFAPAGQFAGSTGMVLPAAGDMGAMMEPLASTNPGRLGQQQQHLQQMLQMMPQQQAAGSMGREPPGLFMGGQAPQEQPGLGQPQQQGQPQQVLYSLRSQFAVPPGQQVGPGALTYDPAIGGFYQGPQFQQ